MYAGAARHLFYCQDDVELLAPAAEAQARLANENVVQRALRERRSVGPTPSCLQGPRARRSSGHRACAIEDPSASAVDPRRWRPACSATLDAKRATALQAIPAGLGVRTYDSSRCEAAVRERDISRRPDRREDTIPLKVDCPPNISVQAIFPVAPTKPERARHSSQNRCAL